MRYLENIDKEFQNDLINIKSGYQKRSFRYDLLDKNENFKKTLTNVDLNSNSIYYSGFSELKRGGSINLIGLDEDIDFINDRIKIYIVLDNGINPIGTTWISATQTWDNASLTWDGQNDVISTKTSLEYPLGVYLLSSPIRKMLQNDFYVYSIDIYSKLQIATEDKITERFVVNKNSVYTNVIKDLFSQMGFDISKVQNSSAITKRDIVYNAGTTKLKIINDLLRQINFYNAYTDNEGFVICKPSQLDEQRNPEFYYNLNPTSIVDYGLNDSLDLFNIPNVITRVATNAENQPITSTYKNYDENDPTSIQNRGREIVDYKEISDIPSQNDLDLFVRLELENAKKVYGEIDFTTSINPLHEHQECIFVNGDIYVETDYNIQLTIEGKMSHSARRIFYV